MARAATQEPGTRKSFPGEDKRADPLLYSLGVAR